MKVLLAKLNDVALNEASAFEHQELVNLDTYCNGLIVQAMTKNFFNRETSRTDREFLWLSPAHGHFSHVFLSVGRGKFPIDRLKVCLPERTAEDEFCYSGAFSLDEVTQLTQRFPKISEFTVSNTAEKAGK